MTAAQLAAARHQRTLGNYAAALHEIEKHLRAEALDLTARAEWDATAAEEARELLAAAARAHTARQTNDKAAMLAVLANPWD